MLQRKSKLGINLLSYMMPLPLCFITVLRENEGAKGTRVSDSGGTSSGLNPVLSCFKGPAGDPWETAKCLLSRGPASRDPFWLLAEVCATTPHFTSSRQISKDTCVPFTFLYCQWPHIVPDANLVLRCSINIYSRNI